MIPRVMDAVTPWLRANVLDNRFWDGEFDQTHIGEFELPEPTKIERKEMFNAFCAMPNPLEGKPVITITL